MGEKSPSKASLNRLVNSVKSSNEVFADQLRFSSGLSILKMARGPNGHKALLKVLLFVQ